MAKKIMQFRYYNDTNTNENNQPKGIKKVNLMQEVEGNTYYDNIFKEYLPFTQLGIQTLPGTRVYLNDNIDPIIIGSTGIYELELEGISEITNLYFDSKSLELIENNPNAYLIIDVICDV